MTTTTPSKTVGTALLACTNQATAVVTVGSAIDVSGKFAAAISVKLGRHSVVTALAAQVKFRLEASFSAVNDEWIPIQEWTSGTATTACNAPTVNDAGFAAADTTFTISSATGITAGDILFFYESGTIANSEWARVAGVSGTTITLEEPITRGHTNAIYCCDYGEVWAFYVNVEPYKRVRLVVDTASSASTTACAVIGWLNTLDSLGTV